MDMSKPITLFNGIYAIKFASIQSSNRSYLLTANLQYRKWCKDVNKLC
jgi:hypothetical protein